MSILDRIKALIGLGEAPVSPVEPAAEPLARDELEELVAPAVSQVPGIADATSFWPESLAHLSSPYDKGSEYITVAEVCEAPVRGFVGSRTATVALVPFDRLDEVLRSTGETGYQVESHGPLPVVDERGPSFRGGFWVSGIKRDERFEPLVNAWRGSDTDVLMPDNSFLMAFGLVPRRAGEFQMVWDDPHGPVFDVVRTTMVADHQRAKEDRQHAIVEVRRDYVVGYCWIKHAAAVAFYYEQRYSQGDASFRVAIGKEDNVDFNLPGRLLNMQVHRDYQTGELSQYSQVWGRSLVLARGEKRVLDVDDPELVWPGHEGPMTLRRASREHLTGYVRDEVLRDYQGRSIFEIYPMSGAVSYRGQWAVSFCHRVGRGHIALELKKLYEGNPPSVIEHWHRYAVPREVAQEDRDRNGNANIAERAQALVQAFLRLTSAITQLGDALDLSFSQRDVGVFDTAAVEYSGWWTFPELGRLSDVVPLNVPVGEFLDRAKDIAVMLESLQEAPMRNIVLTTGLTKKQLGETGTIKLLGTLCQLATTCKKSGHHWPADVEQVVAGWDKDLRLGAMARLYSLNQLRQKDAHRTGDGFAASLAKDLKAFGIDPAAHAAGWGGAVDAMYDGLTGDLNEIAERLALS